MKLTMDRCLCTGRWMGLWLIAMALGIGANGQAVSTTTVQGTVYLANGHPGAGTLDVSWPAFTTANGQAVTAGRQFVTIAPDGFMSVNLAPNLGATPAGLYYTAVYQMSDGTTSTEYWVIPAAAQASLGQVRAQLMPAAQAIQAVSKAYVDQSIAALTLNSITATGGTMTGPLILNGDPTQPLQAADKHYVDSSFAQAVPLAGGTMTGALATPAVNGVEAPAAGSGQTTLQAAVSAAGTNGAVTIPPNYAGTDGFTNPNGVYVSDLRQGNSQQFERSVKEFGAVCDGATDDTNALQSAINYAQTHGVALTIPQGTCKTRMLVWHGESIGGAGKQVSALMGFPGQDVLASATDSTNLLSNTRLHDLTIYVDQSLDVSCSAAEGRALAGSCAMNRPLESNTVFAPGGNGLTATAGTGAAWAVGNCAIAMPATTGAGGNGLNVAEIENVEIVATGVDPMAQYTGAHSTHACGMYLAQWPRWSEFRNIDIRGLNTGIAMPALAGSMPAGLNADSNRWQNVRIQATHGFTAAAGSNNVLDDVVVMAVNSAATGETPTGLVLDLGSGQQGWTVRNAVVLPAWDAVQPQLTVAASGGAVTGVTVGTEHGLGFDPYGTQVPVKFSGSCTAQAQASVNSNGAIGTVTVAQGGTGCSGTTTASVGVAGTWDTAAAVNLIGGTNVTLFGGNLLKGNGGYTVWNATGSQSYGAQLDGGGGSLPGGGSYPALVGNAALGSSLQVDQFPGVDIGAKLQACVNSLSVNGGTCDARNFTGTLSMASNLTISRANATVLLPCATISTANQVVVTAGTRNVALRGCALRGGSVASGSQGGTVLAYSGSGAMVQVGDPTYASDTLGFHMDNVAINTTAATSATATGLTVYRTQELDLESLYFIGNQNQTGMTLDGTGNYTGGTFFDNAFNGFQMAVNAIGHQVANAATTDWMNASTFVRLHIDCPTNSGSQISGTYGINLQQGDGNTFTGGDVEGCSTALHLGPNAQNNTIVGLRNENSTNQVVADAGSAYNSWMTGGTMFTGALTDNGTRNSFLDSFHRSFNGLNGDYYGSQQDATLTNHYRLGIGTGNERGLLNRYQTDYGYRWTMGLSDATGGEQFYQLLDELNSVYRISVGQYNGGQSNTNNQTVINAAGTGAVVLNGSTNAGTGGVVFGSGGANEATVATVSNTGNAQFNGTLSVGGATTFSTTPTVKNQANAEIDSVLWAGSTASQKESFVYKDWNGNSQWYMEKDASNNWELNSATGGLDSFKAYQSTNSGDTYVNASNAAGTVRVNYETGSGSAFNIYGGSSSALYASFTGTGLIKFPGLAAGSGHYCLQVDNSGYLSNTGSACGSGSGGTTGTINTGSIGQIAFYTANGTTVGGINTVPLANGGTGASTASAALANLGGVALTGSTMTGPLTLSNDAAAGHQAASANQAVTALSVLAYGAVADYTGGTVNVTASSTTLRSPGNPWTSASVGKYVVLTCSTQPFATTPSVAQIVGFTDASDVVMSQPAVITQTGCYAEWGTDNAPAFNACAVATPAKHKCIVPAGDYLLATAPYYVLGGANDDGSYSGSAGGSGAVLAATLTGGVITGVSVTSGGSGYTPNSTLQTSVSPNLGCTAAGVYCGFALVTATTNSSGQVSAATVVYGGYGYGSVPPITVLPLGGDGAAATATISGGAINTVTVTNGGGGYNPSSTGLVVDGINGAGCAALYVGSGTDNPPVQAIGYATTNSSGQVTGVTITTNSSGCTTAPTLIFSGYACNTGTASSPVWGQCSNMTPIEPHKIPMHVGMVAGVDWEGVAGTHSGAATLHSVWDGASVDNNEPAIFGGAIARSDITNLSFDNAFIGIFGSNNVNYTTMNGLTFVGTAIGMYTVDTDQGANFANLTFYGNATWVNGAVWNQRVDTVSEAGGFFDANSLNNIISRPASYGTLSASIDTWFDQNFWRSDVSGASTDFPETCALPMGVTQRQTSRYLYNGGRANIGCYRGITAWGAVILPRSMRLAGAANWSSFIVEGAKRGIFYDDVGAMQLYSFSCEGCGGVVSDPYQNEATLPGAIIAADSYNSYGPASITGVSWSGSAIGQCIWSIAAQGNPTDISWSRVNCGGQATPMPTQNPQFSNTQIHFPAGLVLGSSGMAMTTSAGNGGVAQETTSATKTSGNPVAWDANGNTVNATAANIATLLSSLTGCSTANYFYSPGSGNCQAGGSTLPIATTSVLGGVKSDGTTVTVNGSTGVLAVNATTINGTTCTPGSSCSISTASGVTQITAGTNISITPVGGTGNVTINATNTSIDTTTPSWLHYLGDGSDGSCIVGTRCGNQYTTTSPLNLSGNFNYTSLTIPYGTILNAYASSPQGTTIHVTGACTIAGKLIASTTGTSGTVINGYYGGSSGGSGAGSSAGTVGRTTYTVGSAYGISATAPGISGGFGGAASGGNGGHAAGAGCPNGTCIPKDIQRNGLASGAGSDMQWTVGAYGLAGANSGGLGGSGAAHVVLVCGSITGTDGTNIGTIDASGGAGAPPSANSTGAGSGGGGAPVILSSQAAVTTWPNVYTAGGPGAIGTVQLGTPVNSAFSTAATGGTLPGNTTYYYRVEAFNPVGVSLPSTETSQLTATGTNTNTVTVNWALMPGATGYYIFGRTTGAEQLIGTVTAAGTNPPGSILTFVDNGGVTPSGALNGTNGTLNYYTVPQAEGVSGKCYSNTNNQAPTPKVLLGVSGGVISSCRVWSAGTGCGDGSGLSWVIQGGGGTGGTITPTWTTISTTGNTNRDQYINNVANYSGIQLGMSVTGTGIPTGAYVVGVNGNQITINPITTAVGTGVPVTFTGMTACTASGGTGSVASGTYTSGITATGSAGQTCTLTGFNNSSTATATVALTGTNTIAASTPLVITSAGASATLAPTSATAGNGTATCSGAATVATVLGTAYTNTNYTVSGSGGDGLQGWSAEFGGW